MKNLTNSLLALILLAFLSPRLNGQNTGENQSLPAADSVMITIFLKHQQDKNLGEIQEKLEASGFREMFPPKEARVVSWYVMMGIGQVITVKIPGGALRTLNLAIERGAWGAFDTEFYPTYDLKPIMEGRN